MLLRPSRRGLPQRNTVTAILDDPEPAAPS